MLSERSGGKAHLVEQDAWPFSAAVLAGLMSQVIERHDACRFAARGWSMHPFIRDGDILTVSPVEGRGPEVGQVVACCPPLAGQLVVHRVVWVAPDAVVTKGDNLCQPDGCAPRASVLGVVSRVERAGQCVGFGLGPERRAVAILSRRGLLTMGVQAVAWARNATRRIAGAARVG